MRLRRSGRQCWRRRVSRTRRHRGPRCHAGVRRPTRRSPTASSARCGWPSGLASAVAPLVLGALAGGLARQRVIVPAAQHVRSRRRSRAVAGLVPADDRAMAVWPGPYHRGRGAARRPVKRAGRGATRRVTFAATRCGQPRWPPPPLAAAALALSSSDAPPSLLRASPGVASPP